MPVWRRRTSSRFPAMPTKLKSVSERSGEHDAVVCGRGKICGCDTALFFMDANFMMGSMGSVVGEKICRTFERATELGLPVVGFTVSGGARMQEGVTSLMQMAKISAALGATARRAACISRCYRPHDRRRNRELCHGGRYYPGRARCPDGICRPARDRAEHAQAPAQGIPALRVLLEHGFCRCRCSAWRDCAHGRRAAGAARRARARLGAPHEIVHTVRRGKKLGHLFKRSAAPKPRSRLSSRPARQIAPRQAR